MDPMFHSYNGVPQESKLATYMKRQADGSVLANSLSKNLSNLTLNDTLPSISLKKTVVGANEFIPRSSPAFTSFSNSTSPLTVTAQLKSNNSPTPSVPTYQEYVGGTTYFYSAPAVGAAGVGGADQVVSAGGEDDLLPGAAVGGGGGAPVGAALPSVTLFPGTPAHAKTAMAHLTPSTDPSYFISNQLRREIQHKNNLTLLQPDPNMYPDLVTEVDNYHELVPLEPLPGQPKAHLIIPYQTSTYKATHSKTGQRYCLRRVHGFRLPNSKCMVLVDMWKKLSHSNIVQLREVFTTKAFGDQSMVFVYDYHPDSETIMSRLFSQPEAVNGYTDSFSSNPNAPRPYSHSKNSLLRQQHSSGMLPETTLWSYVIQLTGAVAMVHAANLACRIIDPTKILLTGRLRLRLSSVGILDLLTFDSTASNPLALTPHYQQEDLTALGKVILALACRSLIAVQRDNLQTSLDLMSRSYSSDLRNLVLYLLSTKQVRTVVDLMPMIGARYYSQLDTVQYHNDILHSELAKEMENGRLCRLLVKLGTINERPELNMDPSWSETGDRYMLKLFRDHVFHQVTEDGRPFLDMAHVIHCLNKLDAGTHEKVCLMSRDEQSVLVVTYAELKACLEQSFVEILASAHKTSTLE